MAKRTAYMREYMRKYRAFGPKYAIERAAVTQDVSGGKHRTKWIKSDCTECGGEIMVLIPDRCSRCTSPLRLILGRL